MVEPVTPGPGPVLRLTVRLDRNGAELVDVVPVERMALPRSRPLPPTEGGVTSGQWFELRDADDRLLYRRAFTTSTLQGHEQFEADGTITRQAEAGEPHAEEIEVLVPDLPTATEVRFVSDHVHRGERLPAPEIVGSIRLSDGPRPGRKGRKRGLRRRHHVLQPGYAPGSPMTILLEPTLFGAPVTLDIDPIVQVSRPDGAQRSLTLSPNGYGGYQADYTDTPILGPYLVAAEARATSPSGFELTRFRQLTGLIYRPLKDGDGGTQAPGGGQGHGETEPSGDAVRDCCRDLLRALSRIEKRLEECCQER